MVFAPNGTLYAVSQLPGDITSPVVQISGTNVSPTTVTTLAGIASNYWINIGQTNPDGSAKTLITLQNGMLQLVDITTNPPHYLQLKSLTT